MSSRPLPTPLKPLQPLQDVYVLSIPNPVVQPTMGLPGAEREIIGALLEGLSNQDIAARRRTSVKTVANQLAKLFERFEVHSRMELLRKLEGSPCDE